MDILRAQTWFVRVRWADGHRATLVYDGPLWIGRVTQGVHRLAQAEHARRRAAQPELAEHLAYQVLSFTPADVPPPEGLTRPAT